MTNTQRLMALSIASSFKNGGLVTLAAILLFAFSDQQNPDFLDAPLGLTVLAMVSRSPPPPCR